MTERRGWKAHRQTLGLLVLGLFVLAPCPAASQVRAQVEEAVGEVRRNWVPDGRLDLFDVEVTEALALEGVTTLPEARQALLTRLESLGLSPSVSDRIMVLPDPALGADTWGLIALSVANLRTHPGHSQELTSQILMGTPVRILMKEGGWLRVRTPEGYIAWVDQGAVQALDRGGLDRWNRGDRMMFSGDFGLVLGDPASGEVVSDISLAGIVQAGEERNGWRGVTLPDGRVGWLPGSELVPLERVEAAGAAGEMPAADSLIVLAHRFMGRPYLWGGTSAHGVDCSGFMKTVFYRYGIILSRDANQQVLHGREVPFQGDGRGLEPGDLLYFGRAATAERAERVSHTGMVLGGGRFIHSAGTPARVGINSLERTDPDFDQSLLDILLHVRRIEGPDREEGPWSVAHHPWYQGSPPSF